MAELKQLKDLDITSQNVQEAITSKSRPKPSSFSNQLTYVTLHRNKPTELALFRGLYSGLKTFQPALSEKQAFESLVEVRSATT